MDDVREFIESSALTGNILTMFSKINKRALNDEELERIMKMSLSELREEQDRMLVLYNETFKKKETDGQ